MRTFWRDWFVPWRVYIAEFLGTFVFVLVASGAALTNIFYGDLGNLGVAMATGLVLTAMMYSTVHISGSHLNPAVTLALWLAQKISGTLAIFYILSQVLASLAAAGAILYIFGDDGRHFSLGGPVLGEGITQGLALLVEAIFTAILVFAFFATMVDRRGPTSFGPLVVGLVVFAASVVAVSLSGAGFNPARALGPLLVANSPAGLGIWIVGPAVGSLAGVVYDWLFLRKGRK